MWTSQCTHFIVAQLYYIHDSHDIWFSFFVHFTAFYLQAGGIAYILFRALDMVSAFGMDPWC